MTAIAPSRSSRFIGMTIRERTEQDEIARLAPYAAKAADSLGREFGEEPDSVRTVFQRDRDRVLHSKAFRRLKYKTQVFIAPEGDHYRTRLTHSLEVAQIARTIGRGLRLNEDLIEAIALGHDVGHPPFGHMGEQALDEALDDLNHPGGPIAFRHHEQSLRVLDVLEGLNLTRETLQGVGGHSKGRRDLSAHDGEPTSTLEAAIVRISDRIAYLNHDLDDAVRSGIIDFVPSRFEEIGNSQAKRIAAMVLDVIENSLDKPAIILSSPMLGLMNELKEWLFENVYLEYPVRYPDIHKARNLVRELFEHFLAPGALPPGFVGVQGAVDYVAGMTDRFAMDTYVRLKLPEGFRLPR